MGQTTFQRLIARHRAQLAASEHAVGEQLQAAYHATVQAPLSRRITVFTDAYSHKLHEVRAASGDPLARVPTQWLHDRSGGNVGDLQRFVQVHVGHFAQQAQGNVEGGMRDAAELGNTHAQQQLHAAVQPVAHLIAPEDLIQTTIRSDARLAMAARAVSSGTSLSALFDTFAPETADRIYRNLLAALTTGENPRSAANLLWASVGRNISRALTIARTEMLRTYRGAQLDNYRANSDVVGQWQWLCDEGPRTCGACLAMDGMLHSLDEELDGHINCRCSAEPVTKSWSDILGQYGIDGSDLDEESADGNMGNARPSGADWFAQQDDAIQQAILGPAKYAAYQQGDITLQDLVAIEQDPVWGTSIREKSLKELDLNARNYL